MPESAPLRVLVVDDDADTRANLRDILELDGYEVETAGTLAEAAARSDWRHFFAVVLDRRLPDGTAEAFLPRLKELAPDSAVIIVTGYADLEGAINAIRQGAADYILKPVNLDVLRSRLHGLAERRRAAGEIVRLNTDLRHRVNELQTLLDVIPIAITHDPECSRIQANPALAQLLRTEPGSASADAGAGYRVLRDGQEVPAAKLPLHQAAQGAEVRDAELEIVHPDGAVIHLYGSAAPLRDEQGRPRGAVAAFLDVTERKRAQEQLLQTERLAAIGQMVTGLAHESGNALARSQSCLEMLA